VMFPQNIRTKENGGSRSTSMLSVMKENPRQTLSLRTVNVQKLFSEHERCRIA
jgi:hypothetical protein